MHKLTYFIKQSWLILVAAFAFGTLIAVANSAWQPRIVANQKNKLEASIGALLPKALSFEQIAADYNVSPTATADIYKALGLNGELVGYAFTAYGPGFADKIKLVIAMDPTASKFLGFDVLSSYETPGFGSKITEPYFKGQFIGAPAQTLTLEKVGKPENIDNQIVAITGATVTSQAVVNIFDSYVEPIKNKLAGRDSN